MEEKIQLVYIGRVYIGRVEHGTKAIAHAYLEREVLGGKAILSIKRMLFKTKLSFFNIGTIIETTRTGTGVNGYKAIGNHSDEDDLRKWRNRDQAVYDEFTANKESSKKLVTKFDDSIKMLRQSYKELHGAQKQVFINRLIIEITK